MKQIMDEIGGMVVYAIAGGGSSASSSCSWKDCLDRRDRRERK